MQFRSPYNYDVDEASYEAGFTNTEPSATQQQFKEETDINVIARRFGIDGLMPQAAQQPTYGDFCAINDYQTALNAVIAADAAFLTLPASVRERFRNDPQQLLSFLGDEGNRTEAIELGLLERPEVSPVPTPSPPPSAAS